MSIKSVSRLVTVLIILEILSGSFAPSLAASPWFPVGNAEAYANQLDGLGGSSAETGSNGQYLIDSNILVGNYSLEASGFGLLTSTLNVTVHSLSDNLTTDFYLNRSGIIAGRIVGADGKPVVGTEVYLYTYVANDVGDYVGYSFTDSNGQYIFAQDVVTGSYYLSPYLVYPFYNQAWDTYYGFNYTTPSYPFRDIPIYQNGYIRGTTTFNVTGNALNTVPDLVLAASGAITGKVVDQSGVGVANASIYAYGPAYMSNHYMWGLTDASGNYRLAWEVLTGNYTLTVRCPGYTSSPVTVAASQGGTVVQNIILTQSANVYGYLTSNVDYKPLFDVEVEAYINGTYVTYRYTDQNGYYNFNSGLGPGNCTLYAYLAGAQVGQVSAMVSGGQAQRLDLSASVFAISGTVRQDNSTGPFVGYPYLLVDFNDQSLNLYTTYAYGDENGSYTALLPVPAGATGTITSVTFTVSAGGFNTLVQTANITMGVDATRDFVLLSSGAPGPSTSATLQGTIYGYGPGPALPFSYQVWDAYFGATEYQLSVNSSSYIDYLYSYPQSKYLYFWLEGPVGSQGQTTITIPVSIYQGPFTVGSGSVGNASIVSQSNNGTYTAVTISYAQGTGYLYLLSANAVPEFPGWTVLGALASAVAVTLFFERRLRPTFPDI